MSGGRQTKENMEDKRLVIRNAHVANRCCIIRLNYVTCGTASEVFLHGVFQLALAWGKEKAETEEALLHMLVVSIRLSEESCQWSWKKLVHDANHRAYAASVKHIS
ncbi:uncharacterized protein FOMMEDRAFT_24675 [Fomitiporia mediterranea MF3/22]|uniref:uncharacterized protein n=1 Tax=Fomitiporia mediterranea (strain MF3/22) TaxID=694068 RepID=UPI0004409CDC|nr:uncharacterized protein FOMMEDRAFT_24675 [Fomitiporia mediterranea MF3/22]EJD07250.1 hypothetical protein FOMMEDRAFT_24675 [Fomitiporia mediterranea MF3/22]